jgi:hypothetical protein
VTPAATGGHRAQAFRLADGLSTASSDPLLASACGRVFQDLGSIGSSIRRRRSHRRGPAPKPRLYVLALGELEKRIVPNAFQIPEAIKSIAPDAEWIPVNRLSDLPRDSYAVRVVDYVTAGFGRGPREIKW